MRKSVVDTKDDITTPLDHRLANRIPSEIFIPEQCFHTRFYDVISFAVVIVSFISFLGGSYSLKNMECV